MQQLIKYLLPVFILALLAGCAKPQPERTKVYWPPPPAEPKMEWINTFLSEDSFEKTDKQRAAESFFGKPKLHRFGKPSGVASAGDGVVYVSDIDLNEIRVLDFNNKTSTSYSDESPVRLPIGLVVDSQGSLFVADAKGKAVYQFDDQREVVRIFGLGELERPTFITLDESRGRLYVSDVVKHKVNVFDLATGEKLFDFGEEGPSPGQLYGPQGLAIDKEGRIFVAEQLNARIQVFDSEGSSLYTFGIRGDRDYDLESPRGLAFDSLGNLYVTDVRKAKLLIFQADGSPLSSIGGGTKTTHPLNFAMPSAMYIDPNDRLYICDALMNRRIAIWQVLTPDYLAKHPIDEEMLEEIEQKVRGLSKKK